MKLSMLTLVLMSLIASSSFAQYSNDVGNYRQNQMRYEVSSAEARQGKQFALEAQAFGTAGILPGQGFAVGHFLNPDWQIFASFVTSGPMESYLDDEQIRVENSYITEHVKRDIGAATSMMGVGSKNYLSNSFYIRSGLFTRNLEMEGRFYDNLEDESMWASLEVTSLGIDVSIGNQWQWDYFTMGCDWIGFFQPIAVLQDKLRSSESITEKETKLVRDIGEIGSLSVLRFYLGASF